MLAIFLLPFSLFAQAETKEVKIGLASNFSEVSTGSSNPFGDYFRDGATLALKNNEKKLLAKGIKVSFKEFDYGTSDVRVLSAARKAVESEVLAVIGYNYSSNALLAARVHHEAKLPMITPSASANRLSEFGSYVHMGCFSNQFIAETLATVALKKLNAQRVLSIPAADCAYCADLANQFEKAFLSQGGKYTKQISVLVDDKDFSKTVAAIKNEKFDAIIVPDQEITSSRLIAAMIEAGVKTTYLGGDGWGDIVEQFFSQLKALPFKGYSISHWNKTSIDKKSLAFISNYKKLFGKIPNDTSVLAYDATDIMLNAILTAKSLTRDGLEASLNNLKLYDGVTGHFDFTPNKAPRKSLVLLSTDGSKFKLLETIFPEGIKK